VPVFVQPTSKPLGQNSRSVVVRAAGAADESTVDDGTNGADMSDLFSLLLDRVDRNARRAVEVYTAELPAFREVATATPDRSAMFDFAVLLRRREAELAADNEPFTQEDLAALCAVGAERGRQGVSLKAQRQVMVLHSVLTLREIQEAAGPGEVDQLMHMLGWLPANGLAAQSAYTRGYLMGQKSFLPLVPRIRQLARALLADRNVAADLAESLDLRVPDGYLVLSVRVAGRPAGQDERDQVLDALLRRTRVPMVWDEPDELVALLPGDAGRGPEQRALALAAEFAELVARPCSIGAATARSGAVAEAAALASRVSLVSPRQSAPCHLPTLRDVFVELGAAQVPQVDEWLTGLGRQLANGPDLVRTLDAFYRHDMNRLNTAGELRIHPRTLDYRLHRVRELVGIEPGSTRGVRTLSTAVARLRGHAT
jgi:hypothetical protein